MWPISFAASASNPGATAAPGSNAIPSPAAVSTSSARASSFSLAGRSRLGELYHSVRYDGGVYPRNGQWLHVLVGGPQTAESAARIECREQGGALRHAR